MTAEQGHALGGTRVRVLSLWAAMLMTDPVKMCASLYVAAAILVAGANPAHAQVRCETPQDVTQVWAGFDPTALPLDLAVQDAWDEAGAHFQKLYFTSEIWEGEPARVFALLGVPLDGEKVPGILHLHGGGQTASIEWIRFWTARGYAVVSIDWLGKWPGRTDYTRWGKIKGDMAEYGNARITTPSVRHCSWYHWAVAARRALTLLADQEKVDTSRLGVFGVSMGASLTWMVAGCDSRVKTAVPIYGCGWNTYPDVHSGMGYEHPVPPQIELWRATIEPETYARYITCPVLLLSATNDFHANMDRCYDSTARVRADVRQAFTLRCSHHLDAAEGRNLPLWMDAQLKSSPSWAAVPRLECTASGGQLVVKVAPDQAGQVAAVTLACAAGAKRPQARFWRSIPANRAGEYWQAGLPVVDVNAALRIICNVTYEAGYTLSSLPTIVAPASLGITTPTAQPSRVIDDFRNGVSDWTYTLASTDPYSEVSYLETVPSDAGGTSALMLSRSLWHGNEFEYTFGTHKIGDPAWRAPSEASLVFRYQAAIPNKLEVQAWTDHWGPHQKCYVAVLSPEPRTDWQELRVSTPQCKAPDGSTLPQWQMVDRLELKGRTALEGWPLFGRFEWQ